MIGEVLVLIVSGALAGAFGALLGLGGGLLIVPLLTLGFGLPMHAAVGASLICVIVTSSASAAVHLERDVANLRLGMTLELFTASAALAGGFVAFLLPDRTLALLFAGLLLYVAATMGRSLWRETRTRSGTAAGASTRDDRQSPPPRLAHGSRYLETLSGPGYLVRNLPLGIAGSLLAGVASALFGIGGGIVKVPLMHLAMGVPMRVATATSNLMIGVTASAGAIVYLLRPGGIDPYVAGPTALGVFAGASVASRAGYRLDVRVLRLLFVAVLLYTASQMLLKGVVA